jgi:hypothetical protein
VLTLQLYTQCKKLRIDQSQKDEAEMDDATTDMEIEDGEQDRRPQRRGCWGNFRALWHFEPQSQEYVFKKLFGTDDPLTTSQRKLYLQPLEKSSEDAGSVHGTSKWPTSL